MALRSARQVCSYEHTQADSAQEILLRKAMIRHAGKG